MLFVVQDGLSRPRLYRPARPRALHTIPPRSIPHNEPIALRQLQRRHPHQPPRYQSGALLLHELCRRVQPCGCMTDCLTPEEIHHILISSQCALLFKKSSCEDPKSCIASPFGTSSTKQSSDDMTHQRRISLLTKDEQSTSSIWSTLTWSLISSGACIRASLKILRLPRFSPQVSPAAPTP